MEGAVASSGTEYRSKLEAEFRVRHDKDPKYSLRAFAKTLHVSPSYLSRIMSGQRELTIAGAEKISESLGLSPDDREDFLRSVVGVLRERPRTSTPTRTSSTQAEYHQLTVDAFTTISEWYHYAILELTFVKGFKSDPKWIAKMLGIPVLVAKAAVDRLKRLELLKDNGKLHKPLASITTSHDIRSSALRRFHTQVLEMAIASIEKSGIEERDVTSMTMAVNVARLPEAKKKILRFRRSLCKFLEKGERSRVYNLAIQLYPLTQMEDK
jgi:uncharacterized protein (TIGR02147 family)